MGYISLNGTNGNLELSDQDWCHVLSLSRMFGWKPLGTKVQLNNFIVDHEVDTRIGKEEYYGYKNKEPIIQIYHDYNGMDYRVRYERVLSEDSRMFMHGLRTFLELTESRFWELILYALSGYKKFCETLILDDYFDLYESMDENMPAYEIIKIFRTDVGKELLINVLSIGEGDFTIQYVRTKKEWMFLSDLNEIEGSLYHLVDYDDNTNIQSRFSGVSTSSKTSYGDFRVSRLPTTCPYCGKALTFLKTERGNLILYNPSADE